MPSLSRQKARRTSLEQHNARFSCADARTKGREVRSAAVVDQFGDRVVPIANDLLVEDGFWNPSDTARTLDTLTFDTRT
jgi:type III restriction enzyme